METLRGTAAVVSEDGLAAVSYDLCVEAEDLVARALVGPGRAHLRETRIVTGRIAFSQDAPEEAVLYSSNRLTLRIEDGRELDFRVVGRNSARGEWLIEGKGDFDAPGNRR